MHLSRSQKNYLPNLQLGNGLGLEKNQDRDVIVLKIWPFFSKGYSSTIKFKCNSVLGSFIKPPNQPRRFTSSCPELACEWFGWHCSLRVWFYVMTAFKVEDLASSLMTLSQHASIFLKLLRNFYIRMMLVWSDVWSEHHFNKYVIQEHTQSLGLFYLKSN